LISDPLQQKLINLALTAKNFEDMADFFGGEGELNLVKTGQ
jgi:hypothetical protein